MEYIYAAMMLHSAKKPIDETSIEKILQSAGFQADKAKIKALVASLKEVNIDDAIKSASVVQAGGATTEKKEEKKDDKKEEAKSEEEAAAGLGALFG